MDARADSILSIEVDSGEEVVEMGSDVSSDCPGEDSESGEEGHDDGEGRLPDTGVEYIEDLGSVSMSITTWPGIPSIWWNVSAKVPLVYGEW